MTEILTPDLCVIGAGSGGLSVAAASAAFGVPVVLIEQGKMGGDCLNYGCVPSKALLAAAKGAEAFRCAAPFGIAPQRPQIDFGKVHEHVRGVIAAIAPNDSVERFTGLGVRVIAGTARFKDRRTVAVGEFEIKARRFVVATGSAPAVPPIPGLDRVPYLTNETIFDLTECPPRLLVIGGGPIGLELAQAFRRLGAEVIVIEAQTPLAKDDPECSAIVLDALAQDGVEIRPQTKVLGVEAGSGVSLTIEGPGGRETIEGSHLLAAAGRRPNVEGLDLEAGGIRHDAHGIKVGGGLKTSNRRVYAIGDVVGGPQFTHVSNYHAGLIIRSALFRLPVRTRHDRTPWVTYTDPELAQVGPIEPEARKHGAIRVLRWPYHENDRARAEREPRGHIKVVINPSGRILGATIVGAHAGELIAPWSLAVQRGLNIRAFAEVVLPYPTLGEIGKRAATAYFAPGAANPWVRRIIALLRRLG
jgi:pyruvate/2-oxoglutarate dehydrogenase complex dihydrolipoamide dehydrogenase (E3) component